jgi:hypothetical protein
MWLKKQKSVVKDLYTVLQKIEQTDGSLIDQNLE